MCTVSMIVDHFGDKWRERYNYPNAWPYWPVTDGPADIPAPLKPFVSREEFDLLKREVEEMKLLLKRAKEYDERNNEPHCEIEEKMDFLRQIAKFIGADLDDVIGKKSGSGE